MNQKFKFPFTGLEEQAEANTSDHQEANIQEYKDNSSVRSLSIIFLSQDRLNLFYHNLIKHEYNNADNFIQLKFTTEDVEIRGSNMLKLYYLIKAHKVSEITISDRKLDDRYAEISDEKDITVTDVIVNKSE